MKALPPAARTALAGLGLAGLYALATVFVPLPTVAWRVAAASAAFLAAGGASVFYALQASRLSREGERAFWMLVAGAAGARAFSHVLLAAQEAWWLHGSLLASGQAAYYASLVLFSVALLVRADRPRTVQQARGAELEWLMVVVLGCFAVLYFAVLPEGGGAPLPITVMVGQELLPMVWAAGLAFGAAGQAFRRAYGVLAVSAGLGVLGSAGSSWLYTQGAYQPYCAWEALWLLPVLGMGAAARLAPAAAWVRAPWMTGASVPHPALALAMSAPLLVDLAERLLASSPPALAAERTLLALLSTGALTVLAAARVKRWTVQPPPSSEADEARLALGEPNPYLQFATGLAHELNNPLTAVSGWAELALHGGAADAPALRELMASTRAAADVVQQLQRATRSAGEEQ